MRYIFTPFLLLFAFLSSAAFAHTDAITAPTETEYTTISTLGGIKLIASDSVKSTLIKAGIHPAYALLNKPALGPLLIINLAETNEAFDTQCSDFPVLTLSLSGKSDTIFYELIKEAYYGNIPVKYTWIVDRSGLCRITAVGI